MRTDNIKKETKIVKKENPKMNGKAIGFIETRGLTCSNLKQLIHVKIC
jgi:hypothetical protein